MNKYKLHLKSHTDIADYEDTHHSLSKEWAVEHWYALLGKYGFSKDVIAENIEEAV